MSAAAARLRAYADDTTKSGGLRALALRAAWEVEGSSEAGPWTDHVRGLTERSYDADVQAALVAYAGVLAKRPAGPDDLPKLLARLAELDGQDGAS